MAAVRLPADTTPQPAFACFVLAKTADIDESCDVGAASVPDDVKAELLRKIQLFISTSSATPGQ